MTCFNFRLEGRSGTAERVAMRLDNPAEACAHAVVALGDLLQDAGAEFWDRPDWQVEVRDDAGRVICTLMIQGLAGEAAQAEPSIVARRAQPAIAIVA